MEPPRRHHEATRAGDEDLLTRRRATLNPSLRLFFRHPLHVVRGDGLWLYDADGIAYLDAYNNVPGVGHAHPHVVAAVARQTARLTTHTRYLTSELVDYAGRLLAYFPDELDNLTLTCTGTEANELAYRMSCLATGGRGFIVTEHAYHGWTAALSTLSANAGPSRDGSVRVVPAPDRRRNPAVGTSFADAVRAAVADLRRCGIAPAALIVDPIFSGDGIFVDPAGFLKPAVQAIRREGGLFIADEIQAGFARIAPDMWSFERHGVVPDLVTLGKPMGNGYPVAGVVARLEIAKAFSSRADYFNTFGGNPVACAAGGAVLDVIEREQLRTHAAAVGRHLASALRKLAARHPVIGEVRGAGLFAGIEMASLPDHECDAGMLAAAVVDAMRHRRVLVGTTGPVREVVKVRPPLVFRHSDVDLLVTTLDEVLDQLGAAVRSGPSALSAHLARQLGN
jgi:4-aminobutyrate aminotransferase-like enzyme